MLPFLISLSVLLLLAILYLNYRFYHEKLRFRERIRQLESMIVVLSRDQQAREAQVRLSEEWKEKLIAVKSTLSNDIFDFNHELLDILAKNKLL